MLGVVVFYKMSLKPSLSKSRRNILSEKSKAPRKVLISKIWHQNCSHEVKTKSFGFIDDERKGKASKTSISLPTVQKNHRIPDFCQRCGDSSITKPNITNKKLLAGSNQVYESKIVKQYYKNENFGNSKSNDDMQRNTNIKIIKSEEILKYNESEDDAKEEVQEHYVNKKFDELYDSAHDVHFPKGANILDTIAEDNEKQASPGSKCKSGSIPSLPSNACNLENSEDNASLNRLIEFREKNYFECHSAKNRVESKGSVISIKEHKCRFRLYLNDRLFPVAMDDDYSGIIRCVDCHLPLELASKEDQVNGTIQTKVKMGSETKDMVLLLPMKEPLIIKQKRKEKHDNDVVYFGLIRLDLNGDSIFNRSLPSNSLALRYQKGYRKFSEVESYRYNAEKPDIIYI